MLCACFRGAYEQKHKGPHQARGAKAQRLREKEEGQRENSYPMEGGKRFEVDYITLQMHITLHYLFVRLFFNRNYAANAAVGYAATHHLDTGQMLPTRCIGEMDPVKCCSLHVCFALPRDNACVCVCVRVRVCSITIGDSGDMVAEAEIPNGIDASVIAMDQEMAIVKSPVYIKVYPLILANGYVASITCILKLPAPPINIPSAQSYEEWKDMFSKYLLQIDLPGILPLIIYIIHVIVYMF